MALQAAAAAFSPTSPEADAVFLSCLADQTEPEAILDAVALLCRPENRELLNLGLWDILEIAVFRWSPAPPSTPPSTPRGTALKPLVEPTPLGMLLSHVVASFSPREVILPLTNLLRSSRSPSSLAYAEVVEALATALDGLDPGELKARRTVDGVAAAKAAMPCPDAPDPTGSARAFAALNALAGVGFRAGGAATACSISATVAMLADPGVLAASAAAAATTDSSEHVLSAVAADAAAAIAEAQPNKLVMLERGGGGDNSAEDMLAAAADRAAAYDVSGPRLALILPDTDSDSDGGGCMDSDIREDGNIGDDGAGNGPLAATGRAHLAYRWLCCEPTAVPLLVDPVRLFHACEPAVRTLLLSESPGLGWELNSAAVSRLGPVTITNADASAHHHLGGGAGACSEAEVAPVSQLMVEHLVHCDDPTARKTMVSRLRGHLHAFSHEARATMYSQLASSCPFPSFVYLLILWVKEEVLRELAEPPDEVGSRRWFTGPALALQLKAITDGDRGGKVDVVRDYDKVTATLNFIRFLLLCGPGDIAEAVRVNETGVWSNTIIGRLEREYILPVENATNDATRAVADKLAAPVCEPELGGVKIDVRIRGGLAVPPTVGSKGDAGSAQHGNEPAASELQLQAFRLEILSDTINRVREIVALGRDEM